MGISSRRLTETEAEQRRAFQEEAYRQRACAVTYDARDWVATGKNWEAHHVVEARWLRMHYLPVYDARNALRLRPDIHNKHTNRSGIIEQRFLLDCNVEYAFEIMGPAAKDYLDRLYVGPDDRVQRASEVANKQMEDEIAALPPGTLWVPPHMRTSP
jgi:hypothetical protein